MGLILLPFVISWLYSCESYVFVLVYNFNKLMFLGTLAWNFLEASVQGVFFKNGYVFALRERYQHNITLNLILSLRGVLDHWDKWDVGYSFMFSGQTYSPCVQCQILVEQVHSWVILTLITEYFEKEVNC